MELTRCSNCGRLLTDPYSIAVRMGPECRGKLKGRVHLPKPKWKVRRGQVVFIGLDPTAPPPAPPHQKGDEDA